ncbi:MAG: hypothetical protein HC828_13420 [Blastochloris sp.]|nr:hypothetical protein [Blastochloris sp.]
MYYPDTHEDLLTFCTVTGFPTLDPQMVRLQQPDASVLLRDNIGAMMARCSLWWRATPPHHIERVGVIGHYAVRDAEAATALLTFACEYLAEQGCTLAIGPMDGTTWQRYRLSPSRAASRPSSWSQTPRLNGSITLRRWALMRLPATLQRSTPTLPPPPGRYAAGGLWIGWRDTASIYGRSPPICWPRTSATA